MFNEGYIRLYVDEEIYLDVENIKFGSYIVTSTKPNTIWIYDEKTNMISPKSNPELFIAATGIEKGSPLVLWNYTATYKTWKPQITWNGYRIVLTTNENVCMAAPLNYMEEGQSFLAWDSQTASYAIFSFLKWNIKFWLYITIGIVGMILSIIIIIILMHLRK